MSILKSNFAEGGFDDPDDADAMLAALDAELGGIGLTDNKPAAAQQRPAEPDPAIHQGELERKVVELTNTAVKYNKAGDKTNALKYLKEKKRVAVELEDWKTMHPPGSW